LQADTDSETEKVLIQKIMRTFLMFKRSPWHHRSIAGYKPSEIRTLMCIQKGIQHAPFAMKVSDISKLLHVTAPTVTQLINGLEAEGLVERNAASKDRRAVSIKLTAKGETVTQLAEEDFHTALHGLIAYLGVEQSSQLIDLLTKVSNYFNMYGASEQQGPLYHSEQYMANGEHVEPFCPGERTQAASSLLDGEDSRSSYSGDKQV
jgi:Transcriptional regulators